MFHKEKFLKYLAEVSAVTPHTSKYHHETLEEHVLMVVEHVIANYPDSPVLEVAAYLHDIAKPRTHGVNKRGDNCFYGHENVTIEEVAQFLDKDDNRFDTVYHLIKNHMLPFGAAGPEPWATKAKE